MGSGTGLWAGGAVIALDCKTRVFQLGVTHLGHRLGRRWQADEQETEKQKQEPGSRFSMFQVRFQATACRRRIPNPASPMPSNASDAGSGTAAFRTMLSMLLSARSMVTRKLIDRKSTDAGCEGAEGSIYWSAAPSKPRTG